MSPILGQLFKHINNNQLRGFFSLALTSSQHTFIDSICTYQTVFQKTRYFSSAQKLSQLAVQQSSAVQEDCRVQLQQESLQQVLSYSVEIVTGDLRGAGIELPVQLQLFGQRGSSRVFEVGNNEEDADGIGFPRNSVRRYMLAVDSELGSIERVHVALPSNVIFDCNKSGWYLESVNVQAPNGEQQKFPCQCWFGFDDTGETKKQLERNLLPSAVESQENKMTRVQVHCGGIAIPHPDKKGKLAFAGKHLGYAGEDAYFFMDTRNGMVGMGVADGVYAWKEQGIDSGLFSRKLLEYSSGLMRFGFEDVLKIMQISNRQLQSEGVYGSSTCCLGTINTNTGRLQIANLGDSGVMVINTDNQKIKYRTSQQEHEFGYPFQLGHHSNADKPENARLATLLLDPQDVVVMGTDGLFDNLSSNEITREITNLIMQGKTPLQIARHLCGLAYQNSVDKQKVTPYSVAASDWFNLVFNGGKKDDITVMISKISAG
eukprot:TRINITY_DN1669_c0_g3_i2.p1 TRINITY_DN1669_c0_g3~~TRINITY_DN1669_c0_g3_i2.p1  ORF type:complete len:488 (+),score=54.45 TRINITY_DN1669_c0_g3_i2:257-1720(+)